MKERRTGKNRPDGAAGWKKIRKKRHRGIQLNPWLREVRAAAGEAGPQKQAAAQIPAEPVETEALEAAADLREVQEKAETAEMEIPADAGHQIR